MKYGAKWEAASAAGTQHRWCRSYLQLRKADWNSIQSDWVNYIIRLKDQFSAFLKICGSGLWKTGMCRGGGSGGSGPHS